MRVLLVSGMGPAFPDNVLLAGSSFEALSAGRSRAPGVFDLSLLHFRDAGRRVPLLRPRQNGGARAASGVAVTEDADAGPRKAVHLTTFTLQSILDTAGADYTSVSTERIWTGEGPETGGDFDVVLLSTTFIWDRATLAKAVRWVTDRFPVATVVLGGQYSNLKFHRILAEHPAVGYVVRGDAEVALPALLRALRTGTDVTAVPNLVYRAAGGRIRTTEARYVDLEATPSPSPAGPAPVVPYESMRGCPFSCKYCSYPAASPKWRYKSAEKIAGDWARYARENGARYIKALDSTFTVPPPRLRQLLPLLEEVGVDWEAYTRANALRDEATLRRLADARCRSLFIGFESMSDTTLKYMNKKVTAKANRTAYELLAQSPIDHFGSFIVGYPGESPELFEQTRRFLVEEYSGEFALYVFMLQDETMPVWQDAERFGLEVLDPSGEARVWRHDGMDSETAERLRVETTREVRWKNDRAIARLWQHDYESPLLPGRPAADNAVVEKLVDRLGMASADFTDAGEATRRQDGLLADLSRFGIHSRAATDAGDGG
ncbi:radical SAM protein [Amycolatopsis sp. Hca4]|uniref:B12-binding domain-containing radical SAM protein n=1 Tax=Amycolatopsis sp. Hca4 TaxID=2742131 RepID=UPI0015915EBB|nr:radical SAM protein [Amycolatopsis sp. Hca4]QKV73828.1 radical SAM protein [Amycolatopsis sp. Hca4]